MTSQFGQGYAVCLRQFLWHEPRLGEDVALYRAMQLKHPDLFSEKRAVEMWADGAVDHLFDLRRPRRWITKHEWTEAKRLRDTMYGAKWGPRWAAQDGPLYRAYSEAEMRDLLRLAGELLAIYAERAGRPVPETFQAAWELDEAAGLRPQRGDAATCEGPIAALEAPPHD